MSTFLVEHGGVQDHKVYVNINGVFPALLLRRGSREDWQAGVSAREGSSR